MCYWGGEGQEAVLAILGRGEGGVVVVVVIMAMLGRGEGRGSRRRCRRCCCCCCCCYESWRWKSPCRELARPHTSMSLHTRRVALFNTSQELHSTQGRDTATIQHLTRMSQHTGCEDVSPLQHLTRMSQHTRPQHGDYTTPHKIVTAHRPRRRVALTTLTQVEVASRGQACHIAAVSSAVLAT